jgi:hypothetical protein
MNALSLYDALDQIRSRVHMHFGRQSITAVYDFTLSVAFLRRLGVLTLIPETPDFGGFHEWIAKRLGAKESTPGWCAMLLGECAGDERKALERFFEELDQFRSGKAPDQGWCQADLVVDREPS